MVMGTKKIIITGPTGAVGTALISELLEYNYVVTAVCRPHSKRMGNLLQRDELTVVECELGSLKTLTNKLSRDYDYFFHFAWDGTYGDSRQDIVLQQKNIQYTLDAVYLAKELGCKVFIGAGSQSEFGHVDGVLHPDMPCNPDNGYGIAKLAAGSLSRILCQQLGIRHEWCRILSMYGKGDSEQTLVMSTIKKLLNGDKELDFTKGDQVWDYIYSADAARAFRLVAEKGRSGAIYCFGSGKTRLLRDYITAIRDIINPSAKLNFGVLPYYPNQVMHLEADISNLTADTGWKPQISFEDGIRDLIGKG